MTKEDVCTMMQNVPELQEMLNYNGDIGDRFPSFCHRFNLPFAMFIEEDGYKMFHEFWRMSRQIANSSSYIHHTALQKRHFGDKALIMRKMARIFQKYIPPVVDLRRMLLYDANSQQPALMKSLSNKARILSACKFIADTQSEKYLTIKIKVGYARGTVFTEQSIKIANREDSENVSQGMVWVDYPESVNDDPERTSGQYSPMGATIQVLQFVRESQNDDEMLFYNLNFSSYVEGEKYTHAYIDIDVSPWGPREEDLMVEDHPDARVMLKCLGFLDILLTVVRT